MKPMSTNEVKQRQIEILDTVSEFCERNKIQYWLDSGTLIGAVRHKGYIPWDDDIDIGMLRKDFDLFMESFNKYNEKYHFICYECDKSIPFPFGKVLDRSTILYEPDENGIRSAVNIDIFVYDNAPNDDVHLKKMYKKRNYLRILNVLQNGLFIPRNRWKLCIKYVSKLILKIFPKNYFVKKMVENAKKYASKETNRIGNFTGAYIATCDKNAFSSFIDAKFEGKIYKIPVGYDQWLRSMYGDYMQLPPVEKRISHHAYIAFYADY